MLQIEKIILKKSNELGSDFVNSPSMNLEKYSYEQIYAAFLHLQEEGYMRDVNTSIDMSNTSGFLTVKGMFYKEYHRNEVYNVLLKSVITPIIVALLTTLILSSF